MTIRRLRASITRLVIIGAMALAVAAGGVAVGPQHEAVAKPVDCGTSFRQWHAMEARYNHYNDRGTPAYNPAKARVYKKAADRAWNRYINC